MIRLLDWAKILPKNLRGLILYLVKILEQLEIRKASMKFRSYYARIVLVF
jgi:hypothetical protein